jgi:hypothetical protein
MLKPKAECDTILHCKVPQFSRHGEEKDDSLLEDGSRTTVSTDPLMNISSHIAKSL